MREIILQLMVSIILCAAGADAVAQSLDNHSEKEWELISDDLIKERLAKIENNVIKPTFSPAVRSYINTYTVKRRAGVEEMLGRTLIYYPLFEKLLKEYNLPSDLKFLSVVESALNAHAVSRSGAVGLWQFMPPTGKEYGLRINSRVDERKDPEKATRAAFTYLSRLYKKYGNWELALAAYNGGPGRVNRAVKRGRSKNFWRIRRYLPRETRAYIPAFIAATYINHFYKEHELTPIYPNSEFQLTERIKVYETLKFEEVEQLTGTPMYVIEFLNPSYKKKYIPANYRGSNFVLPQDKMATFKNIYQRPDGDRQLFVVGERINVPAKKSRVSSNLLKLDYVVEAGDNIEEIAGAFRCTTNDILKWNRLTSSQLRYGQQLVIYLDKDKLQPVAPLVPLPVIDVIPALEQPRKEALLKPVRLPDSALGRPASRKRRLFKINKKKRYLMHKIKRGESLYTIAAQYEGVSINDLIELNDIQSAEGVQPGKRIKVRLK